MGCTRDGIGYFISIKSLSNGFDHFKGLMDEVSLYNRALSASEIQTIYQANNGGKCLPPVVPPPPSSSQIVQLAANDIVYDRFSRKIYATVPASAGSPRGNSITPIDPFTLTVGSSVPVGSDPGRLVVTDNGQYLYTAIADATTIRRFDISTQTAGLQFGLGTDYSALYAEDMETVPGQPGALAVSRANRGISPRHNNVVIFDDGAARPNTSAGANVIEMASANRMFGYFNEISSFDFVRWNVSNSGVNGGDIVHPMSGFGINIKYDAGRIYATNGQVFDPETLVQLGRFPGGLFVPDGAIKRVFVLTQSGTTATIKAYDTTTFLEVGSLTVAGLSGSAGSLIRWGTDGLAFRTSGGQVFIVRAPIVTLAVTTTADTVDGADGVTSLREAIHVANAQFGGVITFDLPGAGPYTITPTAALPAVQFPTLIDGTSQRGFAGTPLIELKGTTAGVGTNGLTLTGGNSTVQGLIINRFGGAGIAVQTAGNNVIRGNIIGSNAAGDAGLGNQRGVVIEAAANTVGGTVAGAGNVIAFNAAEGVLVRSGTGNAVRGNSVHSNLGIGINLQANASDNAVTANDPGDGDSGPNNLQNFPVLTAVTVAGATTTIDGKLDSLPNTTFTLDFYRSPSADASGYGEGEVYLGSASVTTAGSGSGNFRMSLPNALPTDQFVTVTATDSTGNTSEFSLAKAVNLPPHNLSLSPVNSSQVIGVARTYTSKYSDANGIADIAEVRILLNSSLNGANAPHGMYVPATNKLYLRDNVNGSWLGGFAPLSNNVISNSQGSLNCALTTVGGNGNTLTVNWSFTPASTWMGGRYIYMQVRDKSNLVDGWDQMGTVQIVANKAPINYSLSPNSGASAAGVARTLTAKYLDENGSTDITEARLLVNSAPNGAGALLGMYVPATNRLYLRDNTNGGWLGGFTPGSANVITNGQGSLNCAATSVTFGVNMLTINWSFTPTASFTGAKNLYLLVRDRSNAVDSLEPLGTWTITSGTSARVESSLVRLSAATAYANSQSVQLTFTGALDAATAADATHYRVSVNGQAEPAQSAGYNAAGNSVTLALAAGPLHAGDHVEVCWSDLRDNHGALLNGCSGPLAVR